MTTNKSFDFPYMNDFVIFPFAEAFEEMVYARFAIFQENTTKILIKLHLRIYLNLTFLVHIEL